MCNLMIRHALAPRQFNLSVWTLLVLTVTIGLVAAACTGAATETTLQAETTLSESDTSPFTIVFESCGGVVECAIVQVPMDYADPDDKTVDLHLTRRPATGEPIGTLFMNPGGPGGSAEQMIRDLQFAPQPLLERFHIVGIDPRGTGKSGAIDCNTNWNEDATTPLTPEDGLADDLDAWVEDFAEMAAVCEERYGIDYLASLTTENAARDMETIRVALGDEPLNYLGYSYGTAIGSVYATLFPDSIRSMILDAAVPTNPPDGTSGDRATDIEQALMRLEQSCELWTECPLEDVALLDAIDEVRQILVATGSIGPLELDTYEIAVEALIYAPATMPDVARGLAQALNGRGVTLAEMGDFFRTPLAVGDGFEEYAGAYAAIVCADGWTMESGTVPELLPEAERTQAAAPRFGPRWDVPCDLWPVSGSGIAEVDYTGSTPILVVGNTHDAITPLAWGADLAEDLGPNATLLTWDGSGHTITLFGASPCVDDHALAYLIDGVVPSANTTCPSIGLVGIGDVSSNPAVVQEVTPGGPADLAGIRRGDEILEIDGIPVKVSEDVVPGAAGEVMNIRIQRGDEQLEFSIIRAPLPWELWRTAE